jgi:hypothetical protein
VEKVGGLWLRLELRSHVRRPGGGLRNFLTPRRGLINWQVYPRLTPWALALFLRRFAALGWLHS